LIQPISSYEKHAYNFDDLSRKGDSEHVDMLSKLGSNVLLIRPRMLARRVNKPSKHVSSHSKTFHLLRSC
jgi:hypothetical protein